MKVIVVSGCRSGIGKTWVAEELLRGVCNWSAIKVTVSNGSGCARGEGECGVCEEIKGDFEIVTDKRIIAQKGRDTSRLKKAGAKKVIWLKATSNGLNRGLREALCEVEDSDGVVIEGTSVLRYIKPDLTIYLKDDAPRVRRQAKEALDKADIIIDVRG